MRNKLLLAGSIALTILCWGMYGPVLQWGQLGMSTVPGHPALLRPFVCVGLAYFLIGVIVPGVWLHSTARKAIGRSTGSYGVSPAGRLGAIGALGVIMAFKFGGQPAYVMPLVFGGAPVVNAFLTIYLAGRMKEIGPCILGGDGDGDLGRRHGVDFCSSCRATICSACNAESAGGYGRSGDRYGNARRLGGQSGGGLVGAEWLLLLGVAVAGACPGDRKLGRLRADIAQRPGGHAP